MTVPSVARLLPSAAFLVAAVLPRAARTEEAVLYDTVRPLPAVASPEALARKDGWEKAAGAALRGDGWIENGRIAVWLRTSDGRLALFYKLGGAIRPCAEVAAAAGDDPAAAFTALRPADAAGGAAVTAQGTTSAGKPFSLRCRVQGDRPVVECVPDAGATRLELDYRAGSAHALMPDLFGDDVILRAAESDRAERLLPGEVAVLHPLDGGDALLMCSWKPAPKDVSVRLRQGIKPQDFFRTDVPCAASEPVWISALAAAGIWCEVDAAPFTISEHRRMSWTPPFPAQYRCDLRKADAWKLTDSWRRATTLNREWFSFLNYCFPPLCLTRDGAFLRIPKYRASGDFARNQAKEIRYAGPILVYPFNRETEGRRGRTPPDAWTVLDVLRVTLGEDDWLGTLDVGEGVLQDSPYPAGFVYVATCGATGEVEKIFSSRKEREQADTIRKQFEGMRQFVRYNRARIDAYVAFAADCRRRLDAFPAAHPADAGLVAAAGDLAPLLQYVTDQFEENRETIRTPEHCEGLAAKIVEQIDSTDEKKVDRVKELGKAIRTIGGTQDDMLAAFRMSLKILRQRAALLSAASDSPAVREAMREMRRMTQTMLRIRSPYEGH